MKFTVLLTDGLQEQVEVDTEADEADGDYLAEMIASSASRPDDVDDWWPTSSDPHEKVPEYTVMVRNTFEDATTPEESVRMMIEWLQENAAHTGYIVTSDENEFVGFYDGDKV